MSFTSSIKKEISQKELEDCCKRAQLSALIQLTSSLSLGNRRMQLIVRSENPTTAKRVVYLLKKLYKAETELTVVKKTNLRKNNVYTTHNILHLQDLSDVMSDVLLFSQ